MKKIPTVVKVFTLIFSLPFGYLYYVVLSDENWIGRIAVSLAIACSGAILGGIIGLILHLIFRRRTIVVSKNDKTKIDDLNNLNNLRKNGTVTEEEFKRLKREIINNK